jgi:hypothetical protein
MEDKLEIIEEVVRQYGKFNAEGTQLKVRLLPPPDNCYKSCYTFRDQYEHCLTMHYATLTTVTWLD